MAQFEQHFVQDLTQQIKVRHCGSIVFNADNESNVVSVRLFNGSEPVAISGSVVGAVVCSDGSTVPLTGSYSGNTASITLTGDCFAVLGQIGVGIQIVNGTQKTTVLKVIYNVETFSTDDVVDPGSRITLSVSDLIDDIETAVASIPADYSDLLAAIAPNYSDLTYPVKKGQLCWYDGTLYSAKEPIASTSSWDSTKWQSATVDGAIPKNIADGTGEGAIAEGRTYGTNANVASGACAHAEGIKTTASGFYSHAEGEMSVASGYSTHAEGNVTTASGDKSHAEGYHTTASGWESHAEGEYTVSNHRNQHVFGAYNTADDSSTQPAQKGNYVEIVGNGTADNARSNARTLDWSGNEALSGDLTINKNGQNEMTVGEELSDLKSAFKQTSVLHADNLLPSFSLTAGYYPNVATGGEVVASGWNITDFIPLRPGEIYSWMSISKAAAFYDIDKNFVDIRSDPDVFSGNNLIMPFKVPSNIYFGRFGIADASIGICVLSAYGMHSEARLVSKKLEDMAEASFSGQNARMIDVYKNGNHVPLSSMYQHGYITIAGAFDYYNFKKRVSSKYLERYPYDIVFTPVSGALIQYVIFNDDGTFTPSGNNMVSTPLTVPAGSKFILNIQGTANGTVEEICACVNGTAKPVYELPDYYFSNDYIGGKIDTIIDKSPLDGLQFVFLTDVHCRDNAGQSPYLIKYLKKYTNSVPFVVFGGDAMVTAVPDGVAPLDDARTWQTWMDIMDKPAVYQAQGNHDYLVKYYDDGVQTWYNAPLSICRQLLLGNLENANIVNAPGQTWFYVNIPTAKTRIIFLNDYDTTRNNGEFYGYNGISVDQVRWVVENALDTDGIRVIFVSHQTYDTEMQGENQQVFVGMQSLFTAIANHTAYSYGAIQKDFTNSTIEFVAHICGHMHADASNVNNGVLTIQSTCDAYYGRSESVGTVNEQAFDIVTVDYTNSKLFTTRIGSGTDREFNI